MSDDPVIVSGVSAVCATGHSAPMAFTSMRAGIARLSVPPDLVFRNGKGKRRQVACGAVEGVTDGQRRLLRLRRLANRAVGEAIVHARLDDAALRSAATYIATAEEARPGFDDRVDNLMRSVAQTLDLEKPMQRASMFRLGHAGVFHALSQAVNDIGAGRVKRAIVGGVDTYLDELTLRWLDDEDRLKTDERAKGFVPGEGAAFLVVERLSSAMERRAGCYAALENLAVAFEPNGYYEKTASTAAGLTEAVRGALAGDAAPDPVNTVICDLNGERHRATEWSLAMPRCFKPDRMPVALWHPADGIGDAGAAAGALNLVFAVLALARANVQGRALVWGSSDDGERGAAVLSVVPGASPVKGSTWV
jgi:3-oxoacyl-[acyl-carrier-protein] synthase-1